MMNCSGNGKSSGIGVSNEGLARVEDEPSEKNKKNGWEEVREIMILCVRVHVVLSLNVAEELSERRGRDALAVGFECQCACVCMSVRICMSACVCARARMCVQRCLHACMCFRVCIRVSMCVRACARITTYVSLCVHVHEYIFVYV